MFKLFKKNNSTSTAKIETVTKNKLAGIVGGNDIVIATTTDASVNDALKTKHDTAKNSINNVR